MPIRQKAPCILHVLETGYLLYSVILITTPYPLLQGGGCKGGDQSPAASNVQTDWRYP